MNIMDFISEAQAKLGTGQALSYDSATVKQVVEGTASREVIMTFVNNLDTLRRSVDEGKKALGTSQYYLYQMETVLNQIENLLTSSNYELYSEQYDAYSKLFDTQTVLDSKNQEYSAEIENAVTYLKQNSSYLENLYNIPYGTLNNLGFAPAIWVVAMISGVLMTALLVYWRTHANDCSERLDRMQKVYSLIQQSITAGQDPSILVKTFEGANPAPKPSTQNFLQSFLGTDFTTLFVIALVGVLGFRWMTSPNARAI